MNTLIHLFQFLIPALVLFGVVYMMLWQFTRQQNKQFELMKSYQELLRETMQADHKEKTQKEMIRLQLQAYERMVLFLERIHLPNLITRVIVPSQSARQFQASLLKQIREEYEHNLSQQLYISNEAWELIKSGKEEVVRVVNIYGSQSKEGADASSLAKDILGAGMDHKTDPIEKALLKLKEEVKSKF